MGKLRISYSVYLPIYTLLLCIPLVLCKLGKGWTGRSAIAAYSLFLVALFVAIVFLYEYGTDLLSSMHDTIEELKADSASNPSYSEFENAISSRFNAMFFTVVSNCGGKRADVYCALFYVCNLFSLLSEKYSWFWVFVENYCPNTMGQRDCERCASYSVSFCIADENTCYGTSPAGENFACPFHLCRQQTLQFVYDLIIE